jgi:hypothetical protein
LWRMCAQAIARTWTTEAWYSEVEDVHQMQSKTKTKTKKKKKKKKQ